MLLQTYASDTRLLMICIMLLTSWIGMGCQGGGGSHTDSNYEDARVPAELQGLYAEIMTVHDEMMPELQTITGMQRQLRDMLTELRAQEPVDLDKLGEVNKQLAGLNKAENAMWSWMHNFGKLDSIPDSEKEKFLKMEKVTVDDMKQIMLDNMHSAKTYLDVQAPQHGE